MKPEAPQKITNFSFLNCGASKDVIECLHQTPLVGSPNGRGADSSGSWLLLFSGMTMQRTFIYIDGFNLYHGALRHTPYKWLDPRALVSCLLDPAKTVASIKYFTARVSPRTNDPGQPFRYKRCGKLRRSRGSGIAQGLHP